MHPSERRTVRPGKASPAARALDELRREVVECSACPRLVAWREQAAMAPRARSGARYWSRPVPGFGDPAAWLLVVGLAPGAHGSNRTGRMFTGDRSGEWLYRALHRVGLCSRPDSFAADDGLQLEGVFITAAVRCAPPANRPRPAEWEACRAFLARELGILEGIRVIVPLGAYAWQRVLRVLIDRGHSLDRSSPAPRFGHGAELSLGPYTLVASYHPSQQNTYTGLLTQAMFDAVWRRAVALGS